MKNKKRPHQNSYSDKDVFSVLPPLFTGLSLILPFRVRNHTLAL